MTAPDHDPMGYDDLWGTKTVQQMVDDSAGPNECWPWRGNIAVTGYGRVSLPHGRLLAHRVAYEAARGPIPGGLVIDHLCRNRACVNPAHMEPVTIAENVMRGEGVTVTNLTKTHCPQGHPYSGPNLIIAIDRKGRRSRRCKACKYEAKKRWRANGGRS